MQEIKTKLSRSITIYKALFVFGSPSTIRMPMGKLTASYILVTSWETGHLLKSANNEYVYE